MSELSEALNSKVGLIWAQAHDGVIGNDGDMPWRLPEDGAHFRKTTANCAVIMGRATWESLPKRFRPLPGRINIVLTRQPISLEGAIVAPDFQTGLSIAAGFSGRTWIVGGGQIYQQALSLADLLVVTEIDLKVDGDTYAPSTKGWTANPTCTPSSDQDGWLVSTTGLHYRFLNYQRT